jgi:hypothetical protein
MFGGPLYDVSNKVIANLTRNSIKVFRVENGLGDPCQGKRRAEATLDEEQIREWWKRTPELEGEPAWGTGIQLGLDDDICVVECVGERGEATANDLLKDIQTGMYSAGGIRRYLFRMPQVDLEGIESDITTEKGLLIKLGFGETYTRVPPTEFTAETRCSWIDGSSAADVGIADFPEQIIDLLPDHLQPLTDSQQTRTESFEDNEVEPLSDEDASPKLQNSGSGQKYVPLVDVAKSVRSEIENGTTARPIFCGEGEFEKFCLLPGTITLIGAPTGVGKTALVTQMVFDALDHDRDLSALISNVEVPISMLWKRQLCRYATVDFEKVNRGEISDEMQEKLLNAGDYLESLNVTFDNMPHNVDFIVEYCSQSKPDILVLDYAQRFISRSNVGSENETAVVMQVARQIANLGVAVIVVSATNRGSGGKPDVDCFRGSSELEFGADDAYHIMPDEQNEGGVLITHLKARSRNKENIELDFYGQFQRFDSPVFEDDVEIAEAVSGEGVAA